MNFISDNDIQFYKYLVTAGNDSTTTATQIGITVSGGYSASNNNVSYKTWTEGSVFFRCPALDFLVFKVKDGTNITTGKTLASLGYSCAWINSNRVYNGTGITASTEYNLSSGVIFTKCDDEDLYNYLDSSAYIVDSNVLKKIHVVIYSGAENRIASLDDLNRIWRGLGSMDHDKTIDTLFGKDISLMANRSRESYCPTFDYYHDDFTNKISAASQLTDDVKRDLLAKTSFYNCQPGVSGSIIGTPKPMVGNLVMMKDLMIPIILLGCKGYEKTTGGLYTMQYCVTYANCINSATTATYVAGNYSTKHYTVLGEENEVIEKYDNIEGVISARHLSKYVPAVIVHKNQNETKVFKINAKLIQDNKLYHYCDTEASFNSSVSVQKYLMGKNFAQFVIPSYASIGNGYLYNGSSNPRYAGDIISEVEFDTDYYSVNSRLEGTGQQAYLNTMHLTRNTPPIATLPQKIDYLLYPIRYGSIKVLNNICQDSSNETVLKLYGRWYDSNSTSYISRDLNCVFDINNYLVTYNKTSFSTWGPSRSNTAAMGGYVGITTSIPMDTTAGIYYLSNVGLVLQGAFISSQGKTSSTATAEASRKIYGYSKSLNTQIDTSATDICNTNYSKLYNNIVGLFSIDTAVFTFDSSNEFLTNVKIAFSILE